MKYKIDKGVTDRPHSGGPSKRGSKSELTKGAFGAPRGRKFRNELEAERYRNYLKVIPRSKRDLNMKGAKC